MSPEFPFLVVLVSGGHTQLVLAKSLHSYKIIANCLDSKIGYAVGFTVCLVLTPSDAFDKVSRLLRLPASGSEASGAILERYAAASPLPPYDQSPLSLPVPLSTGQHANSLQFSFSGLISHVERTVTRLHPTLGDEAPGDISTAFRVEQERQPEVSDATQREISRQFQDAAFGHLTLKLLLALSLPELPDVKAVVVSGGVASNLALRER